MARSLTDSLKHDRYSVVAVDKGAGRLRIKSEAELCSDFACGEAEIVTDEGRTREPSPLTAISGTTFTWCSPRIVAICIAV